MLNVVTCYWGDWCGSYGPTYVRALQKAVSRNLTVPYQFILLTDKPTLFPDIDRVELLESPTWQGCLPKLQAYNPKLQLEGQVLLFDLDTVILDNLDAIANYRGAFCARAWYGGVNKNVWILDGDTLSFRAGKWDNHFYEYFMNNWKDIEESTGGRERMFYRSRFDKPEQVDMWQKIFPGKFLSYKNHCTEGLPKGGAMVSFHGNPRVHEMLHLDWVKENWYE